MKPFYDEPLPFLPIDKTIYREASVATSPYGTYVPRITGTVSALSSVLIIYLILRCPTRLSTTYYRIIFGLSIYDVLGSTAIALTTLPMPRDDPVVNSYGFHGTRKGNFHTCGAQAFFYALGTHGTYTYNLVLFVYYFLTIGLLVSKRTMDKCIEPVMHVAVNVACE